MAYNFFAFLFTCVKNAHVGIDTLQNTPITLLFNLQP